MAKTKSIIYLLLKPIVLTSLRLFFKRVAVKNAHLLPANRPVIVVANHQNALLDPIILCAYTSRQLHWLTRADVFKNKNVAKFLHRINMLPVYRERDRVSDIHDRNNAIFNECYERMKSNACIGIFPEGTHRGKKQLVPLKKGLARLVLGAYEAGVTNLCILPAALDYESFYEPQKNLLVKFGEPIDVEAILKRIDTSPAKRHAEITRMVAVELKKLMLHIDNEDVYHEILALKPLLDASFAHDTVMKKYERFHDLAVELDSNAAYHPFLNNEVNAYRTALHQLRIEEELFSAPLSLLNWLFFFFAAPVAFFAILIFWPLHKGIERFVGTVIQDTLFRNSIRISFWTFITPIYLLMLCGILFWSGVDNPYVYAPGLALPAGIIALPWLRNARCIAQWIRCFRLRKTRAYQDWLKQRAEVMNWLKKIPHLSSDV